MQIKIESSSQSFCGKDRRQPPQNILALHLSVLRILLNCAEVLRVPLRPEKAVRKRGRAALIFSQPLAHAKQAFSDIAQRRSELRDDLCWPKEIVSRAYVSDWRVTEAPTTTNSAEAF